MSFYDLDKQARAKLVQTIQGDIQLELKSGRCGHLLAYFSDEDTYIRKSAYLAMGKLYVSETALQKKILARLRLLFKEQEFRVRQTAVNAAGEIGMRDFEAVVDFFDTGLKDPHYSVRNAVIGSIKKTGRKNPVPVLAWAKTYLQHPDKEIRREICHGIELRGRTHPQDILPLLKTLQHDATARVRNTLVHVLGQISYKKGCLATVVAGLNSWDNKELIAKAVAEIIDVHGRYKNFAVFSQKEAISYLRQHIKH